MNVSKTIIFKQIGAKVAYYRTLRGMTQEQLSEKVNISKSTLGRIERGSYNNNVSMSTLLDIADGLKIEVALLVTFNEEEKKSWWTR